MNEIQALIIDDEPKIRQSLQRMLENYCTGVKILGQAGSAEEAYEKIQTLQPNLILLDVQMPHGSGFDLLNQFEHIDFKVIFITGYQQYAIKAFKYHVLDYLLKPVDIDELVTTIDKAKKEIATAAHITTLEKMLREFKQDERKQIAIVTQNGRSFVPVDTIVRCEADGAYTWIHLTNQSRILSTKNLGEYERLLTEDKKSNELRFHRIHYKHLINLQHMEGVQTKNHYVVMPNGETVPIAQRRYACFMEVLRQRDLR